jgi:putative solute:sodium symporter small subunit|tara:strand:+ start:355 stop:618 length:264 start_codon:yes stop_codon:yes gene_type:complete
MQRKNTTYWKSNLKIVISLLIVWFLVSFGFGIIWSDALDNIQIGGFKLGFWFAQQGSIFAFVIIIFIYVFLLNRLDKKHFSKLSEDD